MLRHSISQDSWSLSTDNYHNQWRLHHTTQDSWSLSTHNYQNQWRLHHTTQVALTLLFQDCMCVTIDVNSLLLKEINLYIGNHARMFQLPRLLSLVRGTYGCTMWKHDPRSTYFHSGTNPLGIWYILVWYQPPKLLINFISYNELVT